MIADKKSNKIERSKNFSAASIDVKEGDVTVGSNNKEININNLYVITSEKNGGSTDEHQDKLELITAITKIITNYRNKPVNVVPAKTIYINLISNPKFKYLQFNDCEQVLDALTELGALTKISSFNIV